MCTISLAARRCPSYSLAGRDYLLELPIVAPLRGQRIAGRQSDADRVDKENGERGRCERESRQAHGPSRRFAVPWPDGAARLTPLALSDR